jgi:hypothetical protein
MSEPYPTPNSLTFDFDDVNKCILLVRTLQYGGYVFVVESKNKSGWKRFVEHHYRAA